MKRLLAIFLIINTSLFIISLAISITVLFRPFYYFHINALNLPEQTGYKYEEIKEAYDDVLDYSVFYKSFSTGVFKHTEEGIRHFKDCRTLFTINFIVFAITSIIIILKRKFFNDIKLLNFNTGFWSGISVLTVFLIISITTLFIGFDKLFTVFHNIFFLGKKNWLFDSNKDEIIKILPQRFFMNCAILIVSIICIISVVLIIKGIIQKKKN